jgi:hypothetical protein
MVVDMAAPWTRHPVVSGRCAAVARVVFEVGRRRDEETRGRQVRPTTRARYILPKHPDVQCWGSHTFVEAHRHAVDALTDVDGCDPALYLEKYFQYAEHLRVIDVDVHRVDAGIEDEDE